LKENDRIKNRGKLFSGALLMIILGSFSVLGSGTGYADENQDMIASYTAICRSMKAQNSGLSKADPAAKVDVPSAEFSRWNSGRTFQIKYNLSRGRLRVSREDRFMVWLNQSESAYRNLPLPKFHSN